MLLQAHACPAAQVDGRQQVRELRGLPPLLALLSTATGRPLARAAGAVHNLSSDGAAVRDIRRQGGIPTLVGLLSSADPTVAGASAGALQNLSREVASRMQIRRAARGWGCRLGNWRQQPCRCTGKASKASNGVKRHVQLLASRQLVCRQAGRQAVCASTGNMAVSYAPSYGHVPSYGL